MLLRLIAIALLCGLAACSRSSERSLTIAVNAGVEGSALKAAAQEWGAAKSVKVEVVELPYANLFEKEQLDLSSRTGAYDVIMLDDPWFPKLVENGNLAPLARDPDADFVGPCLDVCKNPYRSGRYYALPYVGNSQLFFYRKDLFEKYKLASPTTWHEVLAAAKKIGDGEKMFGYVMRAAAGNAVVADFMPLLWAFGGDVLDASGKPVCDSAAAIDALRFMLELGKLSPPGYAGFNADEVSAHLLQSTAAMSINWPAWISAMDDPAKSKVTGKIEFVPMPGERSAGVGELGTWLVAVPAASKHAADAFEFIFWATEPAQMKKAAQRGNPPTRKSVFEDAELKAKYRAFPAQLKSLEAARPRPRTAQWNEIENAFGIYLSKANAGTMPADEAMRAAAREIAQVVARGTGSMRNRHAALPWVAPAMVVLIALSVYPMFYAVKVSLTNPAGAWTLANFTRLFQDRLFGVALIQTVVFTGAALAVEFLLGLALALLIDSLTRGKALFRAGMLVPMLLPPVVAAVAWRLIYNPQFGVLNGTLRRMGADTSGLTWTSGDASALASVILVDIWEWTPFLFLLLSAGLQAIPQEPIEAARIDGASGWQILRDVTLPLLKPTILLALLLRAMDLVRIFDQIFILTQGGPGTATETASLYIYRTAFRFSNFGYAAAMSFVLLAATMLFSRGLMRLLRSPK